MGGVSKKRCTSARKTAKTASEPLHHHARGVKKAELAPPSPSDFELPFGGKLSPHNLWVKITPVIPRPEFESEYAENFPTEIGAPAFII
jgi:hypothetical protein